MTGVLSAERRIYEFIIFNRAGRVKRQKQKIVSFSSEWQLICYIVVLVALKLFVLMLQMLAFWCGKPFILSRPHMVLI